MNCIGSGYQGTTRSFWWFQLAPAVLLISMVACLDNYTNETTDDVIGQDAADVEDVADGDLDEGQGGQDVTQTDAATDGTVLDGAIYQDVVVGDIITNLTLAQLVEMGKARLSSHESLSAMDSFGRALDIAPECTDAIWGMVLARFQSNVSMWGSLIRLANLKEDPDAEPDADQAIMALTERTLEWSEHDGTIGVTVDGLYKSAMEQKARLDKIKNAENNVTFNLDSGLPLYSGSDQMMYLCCEWDRASAWGISSFNNLMLALTAFLGSQDTDISFEFVKDAFRELPGISNGMVYMLDEYPEFLTLLGDQGAKSWKATADYIAESAGDALEAVRLMGEGTAGPDAVATLSEGDHPYLVLHGAFPSGSDEFEILWDGESASLKTTVEKVKAHLSGDAGARLSLDEDILVAIGILVDIINRTVGIQSIIDSLGVELPEIVGGLLSSLDPEDPDQLVGLLASLLPLLGIEAGSVEVDLATFFANPFNVRDLFPNACDDPGTEYRTFAKSYECARGGATVIIGDMTDQTTYWIHDPSSTTNTVELTLKSYATNDTTGAEFDTDTLTLTAILGFDGLYSGQIGLAYDESPSAVGDGMLVYPGPGSVVATYVSVNQPESVVTIYGDRSDGFPEWDYGAACADGSVAWDAPRFGESEFASAVEVTAPGEQTAMQPIAADGHASLMGMMAFKSPSFNGLLWVKDGESFSVVDQAGFADLFNGILAALEDF